MEPEDRVVEEKQELPKDKIKTYGIGHNFLFDGERFILQANNITGEYILWRFKLNQPMPTRFNKFSSELNALTPLTLEQIHREWALKLIPE